MTAAVRPARESAPQRVMMSAAALIAPLPELCLVFPDGEMDRVLCNSLTLTAADGTVRVLQEPDGWLPLTGPGAKYTVAAKLMGEDGTVYDVQYNFIFRT